MSRALPVVLPMRARRWFAGALIALFAAPGCVAQSAVQAKPLLDLASFPRAPVEIQTRHDSHRFDVWIADTPERQQQGLMFVRDLPADRGMLFLNDEPRVAAMWMKNTYIPLDLVFIRADGRIAAIFANTTPHSLRTITAGVPVKAVLELRGGECARRGIRPGHRVPMAALRGPADRGAVATKRES